AFGCVLFEMLTGRRAFDGDDISTTLASVLKTEPDWNLLSAATPLKLRRSLRWCLNKDPKHRLQAIGDARVQMEDLLNGATSDADAPISTFVPWWRRTLPWALASVLGLLSLLEPAIFLQKSVAAPVVRFEIAPPSGGFFPGQNNVPRFSVSPDGTS